MEAMVYEAPRRVSVGETSGRGADNGCECVGHQSHEPDGEEQASLTMNRLIAPVRFVQIGSQERDSPWTT